MRKILLAIFSAVPAALILSSCLSAPKEPQQTLPLSKQQLQALAAHAKEPQLVGITIYPSENGPVFGGAWRVHEGDVAAINFPVGETDCAPIVPVVIDRANRIGALLDTSAPLSWTTLAMCDALEIDLIKSPALMGARPTHIYDTFGGLLGVAPHVLVDQAHIGNAMFYVRGARGPFGPLARGLESANVNIVFGVDMLKAFNHVQFNFPAKFVVLSATTDYTPAEDNLISSVPLVATNNSGITVAGTINGSPTNFVIDTGGDYAIALPAGRPAGKIAQTGIGDLVLLDMPASRGMDLGLGQITTPRIGRLALARFKMTLDFHAQKVHFEKP